MNTDTAYLESLEYMSVEFALEFDAIDLDALLAELPTLEDAIEDALALMADMPSVDDLIEELEADTQQQTPPASE